MITRDFHLGDILSITTERLVSPRHMEGVYDILNFMTGDNLFTHQLPRASKEMKPRLLEQHPKLAGVNASGVNKHNHAQWLAEQVKQLGETLPVQSEHRSHEVRGPISELVDMTGNRSSQE